MKCTATSDRREQETTDQLDQCIKILVERCGYTSPEEKTQCWLELLFHVTKDFEVKKWVRSQTALNETVTFDKLLQHAKQHKATVKDFQWHKSNGGVAMSTTINEIRTFKQRKGQGQWARSKGKICGKCGTSHPPRECPAWGKKCHKCGNKNNFSTQCRSKQSGGGNRKSHSTSRGCKGKGKPCQQSRSRSNPVTKSAYSMESASFQDHSDDLHGENTDNLHGQHRGDLHGASFQDHPNSTEFLKQSFSTISRLKSVASISNDTDPEGKTKITMLQLKLPHHNSIDNITVKVDDGAMGNILPLNSFRAMFPHALDANGYPKPGFQRGSKMTLKCYDDGKLINHGSIKLKLQHYSEKSFQDHSFYVIETKTPKPIIVGHPASIRLGLIRVLCKNISKSVLAIEKLENITKNSFQDHQLTIDGKTPWRCQRSKSESSVHSFQDHLGNPHGNKKSGKSVLSRPSTKCAKNETKSGSSKATEPQNVHNKGSFKTIEDGSKKTTSFKTIANRVNNLNPWYMVPIDEATQVISDPKSKREGTTSCKTAIQWSTSSRITIQPHLRGARISDHWQYQGSSGIVPQQLWLHQRHAGLVRHQDTWQSHQSSTEDGKFPSSTKRRSRRS